MSKRIFSDETVTNEVILQSKQEFDPSKVIIEHAPQTQESDPYPHFNLNPQPTSRFWLRLFFGACGLFILAAVAQSVQYLYRSWQQHHWIALLLSLAALGVIIAALGSLTREWLKLKTLRRHELTRQQLDALRLSENGEQAVTLCQNIADTLPKPFSEPLIARWQTQYQAGHNADEVLTMFSRNVLAELDCQAQKWVAKSASENALIVAISPLAVVDMLFMAWRNIALVNKICRLYGMELGYFSRLRLFKMVLGNMAFAGAGEVLSDFGADFFSQNLTAKLSMRVAQGLGAGLLTARLGIKAMEFCRPMAFQADERPKLDNIRQTLLTQLKETLLNPQKNPEKAPLER